MMVAVAQLAELSVVVRAVVGSTPISHPIVYELFRLRLAIIERMDGDSDKQLKTFGRVVFLND